MNKIIHFILALLVFATISCENRNWEEYYSAKPESIDKNIWQAIQDESNFSLFVNAIKVYKLDSLFLREDRVYTLFIPDNNTLNSFINSDTVGITLTVLENLISKHFILSSSINGSRLVQMYSEKYYVVDWRTDGLYFNNIRIKDESPLFKNGKYYVISEMSKPMPNLYEYISLNIPILKDYIDRQDSVILDMERSKPIGFDAQGRTIYDTVAIIVNKFELKYFEISEESRSRRATIVFPKQTDYLNGLTLMAQSLGGNLVDYKDIPINWQMKYLIPFLLDRGIFENLLEESAFKIPAGKDSVKLRNILGDSISIAYKPIDKTVCSNGYAYNYDNFRVPDTLYKKPVRFEGESFIEEVGVNRYRWKKDVKVRSDVTYIPSRNYVNVASKDSIVAVYFNVGYTGKYTIDFFVDKLTPQTYQMKVMTSINTGGIYKIYINDKLVRTFDYYDYVLYGFRVYAYTSPVDNKIYRAKDNKLNIFDCYVDNITSFGTTKITFEYSAPGQVANKGLIIDYIEFVPFKK